MLLDMQTAHVPKQRLSKDRVWCNGEHPFPRLVESDALHKMTMHGTFSVLVQNTANKALALVRLTRLTHIHILHYLYSTSKAQAALDITISDITMVSFLLFAFAISAAYASPTHTITRTVHIVQDINNSQVGGQPSPYKDHPYPPVTYINFFDLPPASKVAAYAHPDYCKFPKTTDNTDATPYVFQTTMDQSAKWVKQGNKDFAFGAWDVGPFEGYSLGPGCTFAGNQGAYGHLKCPVMPAGGVDCIAPPKEYNVENHHCVDADGGTNDMTLMAVCQW
ncbi:MAG: hypothetical protein Q9162_001798 [Coniocarpon cinnabarinum]